MVGWKRTWRGICSHNLSCCGRAEPPPSSAMPSHGHMDQVADGNGTSKRTVQSGGTVAGRASHGVGSSVPMGQLQGSHVQSGLPGRVRHPGYRRTPGAIAGAGPPGGQGVQGGLLSLQLADAGAAPGDTVSPSSFCNGRATHPSRTERTGYPSDVSSPWLSPASSVRSLPHLVVHFSSLPPRPLVPAVAEVLRLGVQLRINDAPFL